MLRGFRIDGDKLAALTEAEALESAQWVDIHQPSPEEAETVQALGITLPSLADMEEIEISNRLYREGATEVLTVMLPGLDEEDRRTFGPVAFMLTPQRMLTVRYHAPRSFTTFPGHAALTAAGCGGPLHLFLGLIEEIVARIADLLEGVGRALDTASRELFEGENPEKILEQMLRNVGRRGEELANYRLSLLTLERALTTFSLNLPQKNGQGLRQVLKAHTRDIQALVVHADFLMGRVAHVTDVVLGMVNLEQSDANRTLSVVAVLFLPPTLVASVYGMNFEILPGVDQPHGYLIATGLMAGSALGTYLFFKWKGWL
ncbi:magnesium transporter CorA family protein [Mameliella sediminis]|uniref:magnesium transporter CorA family protein n=1 Tax=Mameliella sediminis TaxID=2836866 RepID=UPI001C44BCAC|nr:magnesium transporter CorA family protein [Mameliella sediminis]MBY6113379.1 magnesium transporter CorA family protein [Antarctobacter heliothermus]MBY6143273.1 magnesium transporter CorA family protein [Mameliella alba]MBV7394677.1 magnesium transporter CorA family protein [Mameliella sediminis]MBY6163126.1 magnesium transporter CorA family protein [Mameliella alba]MBY6171390.1 magnesium transporter CorA family protein [Mameliella alba]